MSPSEWITLAGVIATPIATVVVAWINRRGGGKSDGAAGAAEQ